MIEITNYNHSCCKITTPDLSILCDPWFTQGIYGGSWYQEPALDNPIEQIGKVTAIYISHIHPDHYDPVFLRQYLAKYPSVRLLIGWQIPPWLYQATRRDKFSTLVFTEGGVMVGKTQVHVVPQYALLYGTFDTALVVMEGGHSVVNFNDNSLDLQQGMMIRQLVGNPTVGLFPYSGAGHTPQMKKGSAEEHAEWADKKRALGLATFASFMKFYKPEIGIPFAGGYWLGGPLKERNRWRGVADAIEAKDGVCLEMGATISTRDLQPSAVRKDPYPEPQTLPFRGFDYEQWDHVPFGWFLKSQLQQAAVNACKVVSGFLSGYFCFAQPEGKWAVVATSGEEEAQERDDVTELSPRREFYMDPRLLWGLLTRKIAWNHAEIGSLYEYHDEGWPEWYPEIYAHGFSVNGLSA